MAQDRKCWRRVVQAAYLVPRLTRNFGESFIGGLQARSYRWETCSRAALQMHGGCRHPQGAGSHIWILQCHYDEGHGLATSITHSCGACKGWFAREAQLKNHRCTSKGQDARENGGVAGGGMPLWECPALPAPRGCVVNGWFGAGGKGRWKCEGGS